LTNKATARTNLDVYSKEYIDAFGVLFTKVVPLGDWNMDSDAVYPGTDLTWTALAIDPTKVVNVQCIIKADADVSLVPRFPLALFTTGGVTVVAGSLSWGTAGGGVALQRHTGGHFDSVDFDSTGYSRGWLIISYTV
jgi:hypothetical protein